jgi:hypothetical protein
MKKRTQAFRSGLIRGFCQAKGNAGPNFPIGFDPRLPYIDRTMFETIKTELTAQAVKLMHLRRFL